VTYSDGMTSQEISGRSRQPSWRASFKWTTSSSRWGWLVGGIIVVIVTGLVAWPNLQEIYASQKDFTVGLLFSAATFFFGRALSRTNEQTALLLIRDQSSELVTEAVADEAVRMVHRSGAAAELQVLERNVIAAINKLAYHFDDQVRSLENYRTTTVLMMALEELDEAQSNVRGIGGRLRDVRHENQLAEGVVATTLTSAGREVHAANERRIELYELLKGTPGCLGPDELALFIILTYDVLHAARAMSSLRNSRDQAHSQAHIAEIDGYLAAALSRADALETYLAGLEKTPTPLRIMKADLGSARSRVSALAHKTVSG
jgi:hypothetical protein